MHGRDGLAAGFCLECTRVFEGHVQAEAFNVCREAGCNNIPVLPFSGFCEKCLLTKKDFQIDAREVDALLDLEAQARKTNLLKEQDVRYQSGPLRLVLPHKHFDLPPYGSVPGYLPLQHCRICFCSFEDTPEHCFKQVLETHVLTKHDLTLEEYRHKLLETNMATFPTPVTPQVHRMLLHAYRSQLNDTAFTFSACACCARQDLAHNLMQCLFPPTTCTEVPAWLLHRGWTAEDWNISSYLWLQDLNTCFSTETYLHKHFHAHERISEAFQRANEHPENSVAQRFVTRVQEYVENMRQDLCDDAVLAPSGLQGPWASGYHPRWLFWKVAAQSQTNLDGSIQLQVSLCAKCADHIAKKPRRPSGHGSHQSLLPPGARADGFWGGPMPPEIKCLSFAGRKIIRLAHVCCSVLRVMLPPKQFHTLRSAGAAIPEFVTGNVMVKPQHSQDIPLLLGTLPQQLSNCLLVQFQGDVAAIREHPSLLVPVVELETAFKWLLTHSWSWIDATSEQNVDVICDSYGTAIDQLLQAYEKDLPANLSATERAVPTSILNAVTPLVSSAAAQAEPGPAEAASDDKANGVEISGALIDTSSSDNLALAQLENIVQQNENVVLAQGAAAEAATKEEVVEALQLELLSWQQIHKAITEVTNQKLQKELTRTMQELRDESLGLQLTVPTSSSFMKSTSIEFWANSFVDLFPRGDCRENDGKTRVHKMWGTAWSELLMNQADKPWFRLHTEWMATTYKVFLRRDQIRAAELVIHTNQQFKDDASEIASVRPEGLFQLAEECTDAEQLKHALHHSKALPNVKRAVHHVVKAMSVQGTDSERQKFLKWFQSLRIALGTGVIFFTLKPRDTDSALTLSFLAEGVFKHEKVSLDLDEMALHASLQHLRDSNPRTLHDIVQRDPVAANKCFHWTVRMTFDILLGCSEAANNSKHLGRST